MHETILIIYEIYKNISKVCNIIVHCGYTLIDSALPVSSPCSCPPDPTVAGPP